MYVAYPSGCTRLPFALHPPSAAVPLPHKGDENRTSRWSRDSPVTQRTGNTRVNALTDNIAG